MLYGSENYKQNKVMTIHTPPVRPKTLSRSEGVKMSLPTIDFLNPGA